MPTLHNFYLLCYLLRVVVSTIYLANETTALSSNSNILIPRRTFVGSQAALALLSLFPGDDDPSSRPFQYSNDWTGTRLPLLSLEDASQLSQWEMGRWPDPILRRPSDPIVVPSSPTMLAQACRLLEETAKRERAVGLAAQQCGVNARMVYFDGCGVLINPKIIDRSPEPMMKVWQEQCLVLPPTFTATVLRDKWVDVQYDSLAALNGKSVQRQTKRLKGEASRCVQHELGKFTFRSLVSFSISSS